MIKRIFVITIACLLLLVCLTSCNTEVSSSQATTETVTVTTETATTETATTATSTEGKPARGSGQGGGMQGSADTSAIESKWLDIAYADISEAQMLDIYLPNEGEGPFPVIMQIHGGAFKSGDKASGELTPALSGLERGYAVVAVNYRLSGEAEFPAQINDIKAAIRYIRANASNYNLDPDRIATWGGSAGGSLSALAGTSGGVESLQDDLLGNAEVSDAVQATVDWFGPIYFSTMDSEFAELGITPVGVTSQSGSPESAYLGQAVGNVETEELVKKASALSYISEDDPPFFIQHGTADKNIPITQSINLSKKLIEVLGDKRVTFESIEGAGHGTSEFQTSENIAKVLDFLDSVLK
jgi:acetyl esterase/lipase